MHKHGLDESVSCTSRTTHIELVTPWGNLQDVVVRVDISSGLDDEMG